MQKTVIFIRHAQSEENLHTNNARQAIQHLKMKTFPTSQQFNSVFSLLKYDIDSDLSEKGKEQVCEMAEILAQEDFWSSFRPDAVVYSPLKRAKATLKGLFPRIPLLAVQKEELECLREETPFEHAFYRVTLDERIHLFESWLREFPGEKVVVVGHSQYFKRMLGMPEKMKNCDVWQGTANFSGSNQGTQEMNSLCRWCEVRLLHRLEQSRVA